MPNDTLYKIILGLVLGYCLPLVMITLTEC